jgi:hypothetical protein
MKRKSSAVRRHLEQEFGRMPIDRGGGVWKAGVEIERNHAGYG